MTTAANREGEEARLRIETISEPATAAESTRPAAGEAPASASAPAAGGARPRRSNGTGSRPRVDSQWLPHQHGAWPMLAVPCLLGVAASGAGPWQLVLAATSVLGYLASATGQAWLRARRRDPFTVPLAIYGTGFVVGGGVLVLVFPLLLATLVVLGPTTALVLKGAKPGTRRDLVNSLAQAAQAAVLVPSMAWVSGGFSTASVAVASGVGAAYLVGTVLVVRSVLRERDNSAFVTLSTAFHALLVVPALLLGPVWTVLALGLAARAAALPLAARRRAGTPNALRPIHVGAVEGLVALVVVVVAFLALP